MKYLMRHLITEEVGKFILKMMDLVDLYFRNDESLIYFILSKNSRRHFMFKKDDGKIYINSNLSRLSYINITLYFIQGNVNPNYDDLFDRNLVKE